VKIITVPKYLTPYGAIEFVPVNDVPGSTHRVAIDSVLQQLWLPNDCRPTKKTAEFFMRVVGALREGKPKYYYVDRSEDPALPQKVIS
jgi:hypothetical protein